jgi:hypothetical protein
MLYNTYLHSARNRRLVKSHYKIPQYVCR